MQHVWSKQIIEVPVPSEPETGQELVPSTLTTTLGPYWNMTSSRRRQSSHDLVNLTMEYENQHDVANLIVDIQESQLSEGFVRNVPKHFGEAMKSNDRVKWINAQVVFFIPYTRRQSPQPDAFIVTSQFPGH